MTTILRERSEHPGWVLFEFDPVGHQVASFRLQSKDQDSCDYILTASRVTLTVATHCIEVTRVSHRTNVYTPVAWYKQIVRFTRRFEPEADNNAIRVVKRMAYWVINRPFDYQPDWAYVLRECAKQVLGDDYEV